MLSNEKIKLTPQEAELIHFLRQHHYELMSEKLERLFLQYTAKLKDTPPTHEDDTFYISELYILCRKAATLEEEAA